MRKHIWNCGLIFSEWVKDLWHETYLRWGTAPAGSHFQLARAVGEKAVVSSSTHNLSIKRRSNLNTYHRGMEGKVKPHIHRVCRSNHNEPKHQMIQASKSMTAFEDNYWLNKLHPRDLLLLFPKHGWIPMTYKLALSPQTQTIIKLLWEAGGDTRVERQGLTLYQSNVRHSLPQNTSTIVFSTHSSADAVCIICLSRYFQVRDS